MVFPAPCLLCRQGLHEAVGLGVCRACWRSLEPWGGPSCARCGLALSRDDATAGADAGCACCRLVTFDFDRARCFGPYTDNLRAIILELKFRRRERLSRRLGERLAAAWFSAEELGASDADVIVPVPLHPSRERERGFNQAALLARGLVHQLDQTRARRAPRVETRCLARTRPTPPQTGLSAEERRANVAGVFAVDRPELIRSRVVVLVDDVMTTGATLSACAAALKSAGARRVLALALARARPPSPEENGGRPS